MLNGVPVIASDLPGVRQPVLRHQMGEIIPIGDDAALANSIFSVIENKNNFTYLPEQLKQQYSSERVAERYENLFEEIRSEI